ncbi:GreA/GreB family elongation factor [Maribacter hydrothermalis]|uniref:Transcription elongation factor GreA n=1 Tax=Maribacter hydrothermalis TaxID=1836467 RepID=A0A1B7Z8U1_9FLAO|nr:GreA/GreB family elongation factor [Maribacter hydrothermalis]APQ19007.1 transcription elongation factor GreA [Maribacter hydrothermalis]OBR38980.1 transcription elongation factor GreA [Maribacter hydrothermalis]
MSRGFVKEEDQEEIPMVAPRADLPMGATNYVTDKGLLQLLNEKDNLMMDKKSTNLENEKEQRIAINLINAKLQLLNERISSAKVVSLVDQPKNEVRFGAIISLLIGDAKTPKDFQIVGVDEANIAENKISFLSPIARILISKKIDDVAVLQIGKTDRTFKVLGIRYS